MVYICSYDVVMTAMFIAELLADHSFYKYLVKHDITNMKDILSRALK